MALFTSVPESWLKAGKNGVKWTKLSCRTFKDRQTRLQLFALAYNRGNFLRRLALPKKISAVVVDDASGEVGKDRGEGDPALEVRDVPTGGGRRAATTVRSNFGADQTACDATRYAHPVKKLSLAEYEVVLGESDGECTAFGRETTPEPTLRMGRRASRRLVKPNSRRGNQRA